jgi:ribosomal-protein-alanine N-acetyltransferase
MHNEHAQRVHLRPLTEGDIQPALAIAEFSFPDAQFDEEEFEQTLWVANQFALVAVDDNQVVGFMLYSKDKRGVYLSDVAVAPDRRGEGIGSRMIIWLQDNLSDLSKTTIALDVREDNLGARRLYEELGFEVVDVVTDGYDEGVTALEMVYSENGKNTRPVSLHVSNNSSAGGSTR